MRAYKKSVIGSSHIVSGLKCQDSSQYEIFEYNQAEAIVMAISDGHGSETYVRSDIGSQLACEIAIDETKRFVIGNYEALINKGKNISSYTPDSQRPQDSLFANLFDTIHNRWYDEIRRQAREYPFSEIEKRKLGNHDIKQAYGCTLLVAVKTKNFIFAYQIGDGRIYTVSCLNEWKQPVPWDSDCEDTLTTSLCENEPVSRFRYYLNSTPIQPIAVFMCSDGIEDCYSGLHDGNFESEQLIVDYSEVMRCFLQDDDFEEACEKYLDYQSKKLSHDDMSIAFVIDDIYKIQDKWLDLIKIRRLEYDIKSELDSYNYNIKEIETRINNVSQLLKKQKRDLIGFWREYQQKRIFLYEKIQEKSESSNSGRAAEELEKEMAKANNQLVQYCNNYLANLNGKTKIFYEKLINSLFSAIKKIIGIIETEKVGKRGNVTQCESEIRTLKDEKLKIANQYSIVNKERKNKKILLMRLSSEKTELAQKKEDYVEKKKTEKGKYKEEARSIKEQITSMIPNLNQGCEAITIEHPEASIDTISLQTQIDEDLSKVLNISRKRSGMLDEDLTIYYCSKDEIKAQWNGGEEFFITKADLDAILNRITSIKELEEIDNINNYIVIMLPYKDNGVVRYISCDEDGADEFWKSCKLLNSCKQSK